MSALFTAYGRAAMSAAGVENNLILAIALFKSRGESDEYFSEKYSKLEKKTLGYLIKEAKKIELFTPESDVNLSLILKYRNWMVHNIARDSIKFIAVGDGENILINNLLEYDKFFWAASELIYKLTVELSEERGINQDAIKQTVAGLFTADTDR